MRFIKIIFIVLVILLFAVIYTQNLDVFTYEFTLKLDLKTYLIGPYKTKNVVIILAGFVVGALVAVIFGALSSLSSSSDSRYKSRRINELEARVKELSAEKKREEPVVASSSSSHAASASSSSPFDPPTQADEKKSEEEN
jgi:predicted NodU family carbamoyl transferase